MTRKITKTNLKALAAGLLKSGYEVIAPVNQGRGWAFKSLSSADELALEGYLGPTKMSLKEFFIPRTEPLLIYNYGKGGKPRFRANKGQPKEKRLVLACRPCDAAALEVLDAVMNWDASDPRYDQRRQNTILVSLACDQKADSCWCQEAGLGPDDPRGSDVLLRGTSKDAFQAEFISEKGKELSRDFKELFEETTVIVPENEKTGGNAIDLKKVRDWLEKNFEHPLWESLAATCLGCGACAFVCPVCHCFDIVDEGGVEGGCRFKNWDSCAFALFTRHGSGHNPRPTQVQRLRQRVTHKFKIYPEKFGVVSCVGCGRCLASCPVDQSLLETLTAIEAEK